MTFICIVEALGEKIRQEEDMEGINIGVAGHKKKLAQYTDDLWVAMLHKRKFYQALFKILEAFKNFCRLRANYDKTEIMRMGSLCGTNATYYSELLIIWTDGPIKILELICDGRPSIMRDMNFQATLNKEQAKLKIWSKQSLTLLGKILVVNMLIVLLFIYRLFVTKMSTKAQFSQYRKMITEYLWDGKKLGLHTKN